MMPRAAIVVLAAALCAPAWAQKWVDEKGRVYYGEKPPGVKVKPAEIKGGGVGTYSTEDLTRKLQQQAEVRSAAQQKSGPRYAGKAAEYKPDMPRGGPQNRESLK